VETVAVRESVPSAAGESTRTELPVPAFVEVKTLPPVGDGGAGGGAGVGAGGVGGVGVGVGAGGGGAGAVGVVVADTTGVVAEGFAQPAMHTESNRREKLAIVENWTCMAVI
jgi:hypothetical protein